MVSIVVYKVALLTLLAVTGASSSGITYYYQQRTTDFNNKISDLSGQVSRSDTQTNSLTSRANTLTNQVDQLTTQIQRLQSQITELQTSEQKQVTLVSQGQISLVGYGAVAYINFTVPSSAARATLNVSFTGVEFGVTTRLTLLTAAQYYLLRTCNCIFYGNYSLIPTTWSSPWAHSYMAQIDVPATGLWILAFQEPAGTGSSENFDESIILITTTRSQLVTFLQGTTNSSAVAGSVPIGIVFDTSYWNPDIPTLSAVVQTIALQNGATSYHYQLYIVPGKTYTVSILYRTSNGYGFCSATPSAFVPVGIDMGQNFTCG